MVGGAIKDRGHAANDEEAEEVEQAGVDQCSAASTTKARISPSPSRSPTRTAPRSIPTPTRRSASSVRTARSRRAPAAPRRPRRARSPGRPTPAPIVVTSAAHGLPTGAYVKVASVVGNTAANGNFFVTALSGSTFSLDGSTGNGAYTSGGTWRTLGLYKLTLTGAVLAGLEAGKTYTVQINYAVGAAART
jgi:hypothetical protein